MLLQVSVKSAEEVQPCWRFHLAAPIPPHRFNGPRSFVLPEQAPGGALEEEIPPLVGDTLQVPFHLRRRLRRLRRTQRGATQPCSFLRLRGAHCGPLNSRADLRALQPAPLSFAFQLPLPRFILFESPVLISCCNLSAHELKGLHELRIGQLSVAV